MDDLPSAPGCGCLFGLPHGSFKRWLQAIAAFIAFVALVLGVTYALGY